MLLVIKMCPEAQAHICIYFKLTAATEIGRPKIKLNKDYHSPPVLSLLNSPAPFPSGF